MKILITATHGAAFDRYFPEKVLNRLRSLGEVEMNPFDRPLTRDELRERIHDKDVVVTHWGTPQIDENLLNHAPKLRLLAHAAGTVARIASEAFCEKGIPVLSANSVMAKYVAESVLGYMISAMHMIPQHDRDMHAGRWNKRAEEQGTLLGGDVGLIGLGTVGRNLLNLLRPFSCRVHVYDPYLQEDALDQWQMTDAIVDDIERFLRGETPELRVSLGQYRLMTQE